MINNPSDVKPLRADPARTARRRKNNAIRTELAATRAAALLAGEGLLRLPEVLAVFPVSPSTWWQGVRDGRFPASVRLGERCTCWRAGDVRALIEKAGAKRQP